MDKNDESYQKHRFLDTREKIMEYINRHNLRDDNGNIIINYVIKNLFGLPEDIKLLDAIYLEQLIIREYNN